MEEGALDLCLRGGRVIDPNAVAVMQDLQS